MLIKVEAINIYGFVYDAQNLSAIRGGGLMLLEMPRRFVEWLRDYGAVETLTEGASKAVFRLTPTKPDVDIEKAARDWLRAEYAHVTVALAVLDNEAGNFFADDEVLTARVRQQQMRSFAMAGLPKPEGDEVCAWDHVRPATEVISAQNKTLRVSASTRARHDFGRARKKSFLHRQAGIEGDWEYTWDMDELSNWDAAGNLNHKIAVFYADGNSFTRLLHDALENAKPDKQEKVIRGFDRYLQAKRRAFLAALLERTGEDQWKTAEDHRRIEALLWGGDELMLVVPAWCGWEIADLFCQTMKGAEFQDGPVKIPLKHGMGLVFAHHNAPIHALTRLVRDLAEESKGDRSRDRLSYLVLESFDHVGEDLKRFRDSRCPEPVVLTADGGALAEIGKALKKLKDEEFPRRKVYEAALGIAPGKDWEAVKKDIEPFVKPWEQTLAEWRKWTGGGRASWYHLAELWDYVGLEL
jgi:hypothetical protein